MPRNKIICPQCKMGFHDHPAIQAHWHAEHEYLMPFTQAWLAISDGTYGRSKGPGALSPCASPRYWKVKRE